MKLTFNKIKEGVIEYLLLFSGLITSITVMLIIIFLFREGLSLFDKPLVEESSVVLLHKDNPVKFLKAAQIKDIFNQEITNWKDLGGKDEEIKLFTVNDLSNYYTDEELGENLEHVPEKIAEMVEKTPEIIAFVSQSQVPSHFTGKRMESEKVSLKSLFTGRQWYPTSQPAAQLGLLPLILGTLTVSLVAILIALPLGLATAIYLAEIAHPVIRNILKPVIELLAGIPSVVYGFFGLVVLVPLVKDLFHLDVGETALTGSIILAIMALPTIITITEDALRTTPKSMKEASLALGATRWQTIVRVTIPYSVSGITSAAILGIGRAVGETMAVLMVTGNASTMPHTLLQPVRTIPATIASELGEAPYGGLHFKALFALGCILFLITFLTNLSVEFISNKRKMMKI